MGRNARVALILFVALVLTACSLPFLGGSKPPDFSALETAAQSTVAARATQDALFRDAATALFQTIQATNAAGPTPAFTSEPVGAPVTAATLPPPEQMPTAGPAPSTTLIVQPVRPTAAPQIPVVGRFTFSPGATSGLTGGDLPAGAVVDYLVNAQAAQLMMVSVYSPNNDVRLGVAGIDGAVLQRVNAGQTDFSAVLPASQDYRLTLAGPPQASPFTLQVILPARIRFAPGAISASLDGSLPANETNFYLANARRGQTMTVRIVSGSGAVFLTIYGLDDGSPLVRSMMAQTEWSDVLPLDQDYMIQAVNTGSPVFYRLEVVIE